ISRPGSPLPMAIGSRPSAATSAVIRTGTRRSDAPRSAVASPQGSPSTVTRCSKCEIIMIEFRVLGEKWFDSEIHTRKLHKSITDFGLYRLRLLSTQGHEIDINFAVVCSLCDM